MVVVGLGIGGFTNRSVGLALVLLGAVWFLWVHVIYRHLPWIVMRRDALPTPQVRQEGLTEAIGLPRLAARRRIRRRIDLGTDICEMTSPNDPYFVSHYPPEQRDAKFEEALRRNIPHLQAVVDWHSGNIAALEDIGLGTIHHYPSEEPVPDDYRWYRTWVERRMADLERIEDLL